MRLTDLPRTGAFRLAMLFLTLFGATSAVIFAFLYIQTERFLTANIDGWLRRESRLPFAASVQAARERFDIHAQGSFGKLDRVFVLYDASGRRIAGDRLAAPAGAIPLGRPFDYGIPAGARLQRFRGIAHRYPGGATGIIAQNLYASREFDETVISTMLWGGLLTTVLGLGGAIVVGMGTVRRFDAVAYSIQEIISGDLSRRLPTHGTSGDLDRLVIVVNGMLDDIERLMHDVKGVCDGIAHDLRTPLTRILAGLERSRRRAGTVEDYGLAVDDAIAELRGVLRTFSAMLRIAELEDGARRAGFRTVDLARIATDIVDFYDPAAEEKAIALTIVTGVGAPFLVQGDSSLLFDALANLVDNAIKFTPPRGRVTLELGRREGTVTIGVADTGIGIPPEERDSIFQRFYRAEQSRTSPGNGLGLTLVSAIARLHNIRVTLEPLSPGTRIILTGQPV